MTNMFRESSGNYLSPVHHHLEACQPLLIICRNLCEILQRRPSSACVCALFSLRKSFFRSEHCVFVLTGFITDNIVCSSLLRLHIVVHIKPPGSRRAVFVLLCFSFHFAISYWQTWFALSRGWGTECWNSLQTQKLLSGPTFKVPVRYVTQGCLCRHLLRQTEGKSFGVFCCLFQF